jgi:hypothetical protein
METRPGLIGNFCENDWKERAVSKMTVETGNKILFMEK